MKTIANFWNGGRDRDRTRDPYHVKVAVAILCHPGATRGKIGLGRWLPVPGVFIDVRV
jgi:hypothetical protein